jgi:hypothetical protein
MGRDDGRPVRRIGFRNHVDCPGLWGAWLPMSEYEKCTIYRTSEWVIWDPNKKMLHLFDTGEAALKFFNDGMVVIQDEDA